MSTDNESTAAARWSGTAAETGQKQLGEFLPHAPNAWFAAAELKFEVVHITGERERFAHTVGAMGFTVLRAVLDLVENPLADVP